MNSVTSKRSSMQNTTTIVYGKTQNKVIHISLPVVLAVKKLKNLPGQGRTDIPHLPLPANGIVQKCSNSLFLAVLQKTSLHHDGLSSLSKYLLITDRTRAEQPWLILSETWIPAATSLLSDKGGSSGGEAQAGRAGGHCAKQRGKRKQAQPLFCASARGAPAPSAETGPHCTEEASPVSKCLVLRGSRAILSSDSSSIFQGETAVPTAGMALVPLPCSSSYRERRQGKANAPTEQIQPSRHPQPLC